ncbi:MAG: head-tail connector protein [Pseudomonadota bacterium]
MKSVTHIAPPNVEPVSLTEAKLHLRIDHSDEDSYIAGLIVAARRLAEKRTGRSFITQTWALTMDAFADPDVVELRRGPVQSIDHFRVYDADDAAETVAATAYRLDGEGAYPRLTRRGAASWPRPGRRASGIEIQYRAGFGDTATDVPQDVRQAILTLAAHLYERREILSERRLYEAPPAFSALLAPYMAVRI